jgi:hypothetical protein
MNTNPSHPFAVRYARFCAECTNARRWGQWQITVTAALRDVHEHAATDDHYPTVVSLSDVRKYI